MVRAFARRSRHFLPSLAVMALPASSIAVWYSAFFAMMSTGPPSGSAGAGDAARASAEDGDEDAPAPPAPGRTGTTISQPSPGAASPNATSATESLGAG